MSIYRYSNQNISTYLDDIYSRGLHRSRYLTDEEIKKILSNIGIFRFKGYLYAFRSDIAKHSIDDVITLYYFDKYLTRYVMEFTASIETILKTRAVELCYKWTSNPFFYLLQENHKFKNFHINQPTLENWKNRQSRDGELQEHYTHYCLYYKNKYSFQSNRATYLQTQCIKIDDGINYPPFHYMMESATLGAAISLIKSIKIGKYDLLHGIAKEFGINPKIFKQYLDRLNEVRNRAAHQERLFNRSFRSVRAFKAYHNLRKAIESHSFVDVYLYFYFMLNRIDNYKDIETFYRQEIVPLFDGYRRDHLIVQDTFGLNRAMKDEDFFKLEIFILNGMGIKKASHDKVMQNPLPEELAFVTE